MTQNPFKVISVIGLGYIGLPTAAMFASTGIKVIGVDINKSIVDTINTGGVRIVEPGLQAMVEEVVVKQKTLRATREPEPADAFLITVPTPAKGEQNEPDLSFVKAAALSIAPVLKIGDLVVLESTVPVGTTERMADWLAQARPDLSFPQHAGAESDIRIAFSPERVLPGKVLTELLSNDRIIGGMTPTCAQYAATLYSSFTAGSLKITSGPRVSELSKLSENSYRDVNIAFANELSIVCEELNVDVWELIELANLHPRVNILQPGPGVGGHCIAIDPWFIVTSAPNDTHLIRTARKVNLDKPAWVIKKILTAMDEYLSSHPNKNATDITLVVYGLAFKPDIDDLRESPAIQIVLELAQTHKGSLLIVEPYINQLPSILKPAKLVSIEDAQKADVSIMLVDHAIFKDLQPPKGLKVDCRGIWNNR